MDSIDLYLARQRVRMKVASARADARLKELGGEPRRSVESLSAAELDRDTLSLKRIMRV
jgi:hypothetical protein